MPGISKITSKHKAITREQTNFFIPKSHPFSQIVCPKTEKLYMQKLHFPLPFSDFDILFSSQQAYLPSFSSPEAGNIADCLGDIFCA